MKTFRLVRDVDISGVSGVGVIAEGALFSSGKAVLAWLTQYRSVAVYDGLDDLLHIHGHGGNTRLVWD